MRLAYIDTSFILSILLKTEKSDLAEQILEAYSDSHFTISGIAINEALYVATYEYYRQKGIVKGGYGLSRLISKQGYPREVIDAIDSFLKDLNTKIINDYFDYDEYLQIIQNFKLLPNDAQIALTCKHYGINTILTFDEDFKRIPWLRVAP
ncbi:MAG: hypothetical protein B7O98_00425 [Zestosphaera tikiterensis]|uniref:PIN domain-containing protein n=1 Tax=Zestosphaera tikiterensis TaxID=1973259 RepID=A0A2R7Y8R6_9CREN|nr:MAG: hypothetical protein B7O98_00425 [Zestosphaera tikiterensis]